MNLSTIPPGVSPLTAEQAQQVEQLLQSLEPMQQVWLSGYLAAAAGLAAPSESAPAAEAAPLTILYGSETGNAKGVAEELASKAAGRGLNYRLVNMADYKPAQLKHERFLAIVVSTHGEGDPPATAEKLHAFLGSKKAPRLEGAKVAVIGLGDSSYEFFCQTAVDFDERLSGLGATVVVERALLDVDYDDTAPAWTERALDVFEPEVKAAGEAAAGAVRAPQVIPLPGLASAAESQPVHTKKNPFAAEVGVVQKITGRDSGRDIRHVELSLEGSGLRYRPGDSLGVYFTNDAGEVDEVLRLLELAPDSPVTVGDSATTIREALLNDLELTQSYPGFVEKYARATGLESLLHLVSDKTVLRAWLGNRQIYDVIHDYPAAIGAQALVDCLRRVQPRLYSIASSMQEVEDEVHLTVAAVDYEAFDRPHLGGCSGYLCRRIGEGDRVRVYVENNDGFRLPSNPDTPVVMVGPGTGIAPFRAFLQEREVAGATGGNWLFFGNPNFTQDFLYQVELSAWRKSGLLTKLDVAFSRDQADKIYVQHRMLEEGAELWRWLEQGAHFYVCGDASRMAKDVHAALLEVIATHGGLSAGEAEAYVERLRDARRYQRDVY